MKDLRCPWFLFVLALSLGNLLGCEALQGRQAPASIESPLAVTASSLDFGTVVVGSSGYLSETVSNRGSFRITILQATVTSPEFTIVRPRFPLAIPAGGSVEIFVRFTPQTAGSPSAVVAIGGARHSTTVTLTGTAILPGKFSAAPASVSFGKVTKGKTQVKSETFTNIGSTNITVSQAAVSNSAFQLTGPSLPLVLAPSQSAVFNLAFTPQTVGAIGGALSVTSSASLVASNRASIHSRIRRRGISDSSATIPLTGTGAGQSQLAASPSSLSFGSAKVGASMTKTVTLSNPGTPELQITQASVTGAGFRLSGANVPMTLQPGQSANLNIIFSPPAAGNQSGSLTLIGDGAAPVMLISLSGNSPIPDSGTLTANLDSLVFGSVKVGDTKTQSGILTNSGSSAVMISQANVSGGAFKGTGLALPQTLSPGQSTAFTVSYTPTVAGNSSGNVSFVSDASNSTLAVTLSGTATAAPTPGSLTSSAASLNFGSVPVGNTKSQPEMVKNTGGSPVTISQANLTGVGFSLDGLYLPLELNAGESFTFQVVFAPGSSANTSGTLSLVSNASNTLPAVSLSGSGATAGQLIVTPASLSFGNVTVGTSKSLTTTLSAATASVSISSGELSDPEFTLSGAAFPLTLSAGQSIALTLTFTPQASGSAAGSLALATNTSTATITQTLGGSASAAAHHSVALSWDGSAPAYFVYRGTTAGGPYAKITASATASTSFNDTSVQSGGTYFYVTTSVDANGTESNFSNEVSAAIPTS